jgi:glycosyltransferase involved in cell wall biosynthesis
MKLLQITKKFPYPLHDGESIAVTNLSKALVQLGWEVDLLAMNTSKHPFFGNQRPDALSHYGKVSRVSIDNEVHWRGAISHLLKGKSYQAERFIDFSFEQKIGELLRMGDYDVVQLESFYLSPYIDAIRRYSHAHVSMRAHNIEHLIWRRLAEHTSIGLKKWYLNRISRELEQLESAYFPAYDSILSISPCDEEKFVSLGYEGVIQTISIGLETDDYDTVSPAGVQNIGFIGTLDWRPNEQGLQWFIDEVWGHCLNFLGPSRLFVAGRGASPALQGKLKSTPYCKFFGAVPCANEFLQKNAIMIVPLLSGSGMRVKIIEGMAKGMLIITTRLGLEGIPARHEREVFVADSPKEFAEAIRQALNSPEKVRKMQRNAISFVKDHFDMLEQGRRLHGFYCENLPISEQKQQSMITFNA